jgi:hypothetical protein
MKINDELVPVPAKELKNTIFGLKRLICKSFAENLLDELARTGIDLSNNTRSYIFWARSEKSLAPFSA